MNAIHSTTILYNETPTITQIHHFYALMTTFQTDVFISKQGTLTSIKNLSTLVSFFLTVKKREPCIIYIWRNRCKKSFKNTLSFLKVLLPPIPSIVTFHI